MQHSIFSGAGVGIKFEASSPELRNVLIERNTFHRLELALVFTQMSKSYPQSTEVPIRENLFVEITGPEAVIQNGFHEPDLMRIFATSGLAANGTSRPESKRGVRMNWTSLVFGDAPVSNRNSSPPIPLIPGFCSPQTKPSIVESERHHRCSNFKAIALRVDDGKKRQTHSDDLSSIGATASRRFGFRAYAFRSLRAVTLKTRFESLSNHPH